MAGTISAPSTNDTPLFGGIGNLLSNFGSGVHNLVDNVTYGSAINPSPIYADYNPSTSFSAPAGVPASTQMYSTPAGPANPNPQPTNTQPSGPAPVGNGGSTIGSAGPAPSGWTQAQWQQNYDYLQQQMANQRNQISSGWDNYLSSLNDVLNNGLPQQQTAQNNIANDQYNQGVNTINSQKASSLKDIANNIKNAFQAGNIYLGSRGAGDSSASNQYSFALNQEAAKQGSDLNQFVNTNLNNLASQRDAQINNIANWYAGAQNQLKSAIAQGQVSKAEDVANISSNLLNQGLSMLNQVQTNSQNQYNALVNWAANNSTSLGQLKSNIAQIPQPIGPMQVDSSGNAATAPVGYGYSNDTTNKAPIGYGATNTNQTQTGGLFSNPAWFQ